MSLWFWVVLTLLCIAVQSFFAMMEMALVSFNKVRLGYWVDKGMRRARWVHSLVQHPARLFGTTLLGVNIALQVGSECSREVYRALRLSPDIAPITQLFLVMIFAELAPLFAARRYAERVAMLGIPIVYIVSLLVRPLIWLIGLISAAANWLVGGPRGPVLSVLSREEMQHMVEGREVDTGDSPFNLLVTNIFNFRQKIARDVMTPLQALHMLSADASVEGIADLMRQFEVPCVPLYFRTRRHVIAVAFARDLVKVADSEPIRNHARPPWFITQSTPIGQILKQFRYNNQSVAVVLDLDGQAVGLLTLDDILDELFGETEMVHQHRVARTAQQQALVEKTLPANTRLIDFNRDFGAHLRGDESDTLGHIITHQLGHLPEAGESIQVEGFELRVVDATLLGARTIAVRSLR